MSSIATTFPGSLTELKVWQPPIVSLIALLILNQRESQERQTFEFSIEKPWTCFPMPSKALIDTQRTLPRDDDYVFPQNRLLTQPRPDVAVAFHRRAIMSDHTWTRLTWPMRKLAGFENPTQNNFNVFPFLAIEAEISARSVDDIRALHRCLNCASQALFNFYEFFNDADLKKEFLDDVRFFTIVTNETGVLIRIHRAIEFPEDDIAGRVIPDDGGYRLEFEFEELARLEETDQFSRSRALDVIKRLLKYAEETLRLLLQKAIFAFYTKLNSRDTSFLLSRTCNNAYRHGQDGIANARDVCDS